MSSTVSSHSISQTIWSSSPVNSTFTSTQPFPLSSSPLASPTAILKQYGGRANLSKKPEDKIWEVPNGFSDEKIIPLAPQKLALNKVAGGATKQLDICTAPKPTILKASKAVKTKKPSKVLRDISTNKDVLNGTKSEYFVDKQAKRKRIPKKDKVPEIKRRVATEVVEAVVEISQPPEQTPPPKRSIPQRRQWTPVKDTIQPIELNSSEQNKENQEPATLSFSERIEGLRFSRETSLTRERSASVSLEYQGLPMLKMRKRNIEMLSIPNVVRKPGSKPEVMEKTPKAKKPKKKAISITALATAQYRTEGEVHPIEPITKYFSIKKATAPKRKSTIPTYRAIKKDKKEEEEIVALLSPTSALRELEEQSFDFGTCSQLEQDHNTDSAQNLPLESISSKVEEVQNGASLPIGLLGMRGFIQKRSGCGLWDAAAKDTDEGLGALAGYTMTQLPIVDLSSSDSTSLQNVSTLNVPPNSPKSSHPLIIAEPPSKTSMNKAKGVTIDLTDSPVIAKTDSLSERSRTPTITIPFNSLTKSNPALPQEMEAIVQFPGMPDFKAYPSTRLQAELNAFGFKKIGNRAAMVATMEMCWKAQNKSKAPTTEFQSSQNTDLALIENPPEHACCVPVETSRKKRAASSTASVRIPKSHQRQAFDSEVDETSPRLSSESIHRKISQAVCEAANPNYPSSGIFYRQILMYDPIVLEDLTAWLNTSGLETVGVDEEVHIGEVRAWCDANSICCLAKETQRGNERKRY